LWMRAKVRSGAWAMAKVGAEGSASSPTTGVQPRRRGSREATMLHLGRSTLAREPSRPGKKRLSTGG
jgi:hypothetical protein